MPGADARRNAPLDMPVDAVRVPRQGPPPTTGPAPAPVRPPMIAPPAPPVQPPMPGYPPGAIGPAGYPGYPYGPMMPQPPLLPGAVAALVCGIVSLMFWPFGVPLGIVALVLGAKANKAWRANPYLRGRGLALAGIGTGIGGIALSAIIVMVMVFAFSTFPIGDYEVQDEPLHSIEVTFYADNLDADAADELVATVHGQDENQTYWSVRMVGNLTLRLQSSVDGAAWTDIASRHRPVDTTSSRYAYGDLTYRFSEVEVDDALQYRVLATFVTDDGATFEDASLERTGGDLRGDPKY